MIFSQTAQSLDNQLQSEDGSEKRTVCLAGFPPSSFPKLRTYLIKSWLIRKPRKGFLLEICVKERIKLSEYLLRIDHAVSCIPCNVIKAERTHFEQTQQREKSTIGRILGCQRLNFIEIKMRKSKVKSAALDVGNLNQLKVCVEFLVELKFVQKKCFCENTLLSLLFWQQLSLRITIIFFF